MDGQHQVSVSTLCQRFLCQEHLITSPGSNNNLVNNSLFYTIRCLPGVNRCLLSVEVKWFLGCKKIEKVDKWMDSIKSWSAHSVSVSFVRSTLSPVQVLITILSIIAFSIPYVVFPVSTVAFSVWTVTFLLAVVTFPEPLTAVSNVTFSLAVLANDGSTWLPKDG